MLIEPQEVAHHGRERLEAKQDGMRELLYRDRLPSQRSRHWPVGPPQGGANVVNQFPVVTIGLQSVPGL
jgi:hypothetical protein